MKPKRYLVSATVIKEFVAEYGEQAADMFFADIEFNNGVVLGDAEVEELPDPENN